jgi:hypothetical protein
MKIHLTLALVSLLVLTIFLPAQGQSFNKVKQAQLEGLNITMTLKKTPASQEVNWPTEPITLTAQSIAVNGKLINQLLMDNYISPDMEAFSVVYALNPQIQKLSNLNVLQIRIPVVKGGRNLTAIFRRGFRVFLTVDKELKDRFIANVRGLSRLNQTVSTFGDEKFQNLEVKQSVIISLQNISDVLSHINDRLIQRFGRPIPTEALNQLNAEVELLNKSLSGKGLPGARISKEEQNQIATIEKDIAIKKRAYIETASFGPPDRWPEVTVIVKTIRGGREVPSLRIYYVPEALKGQDSEIRSFGILSSPSNQSLPEADYCFWAAKDPDKTAVTIEQCIEVRTNRQAEVQLTVIR